MKVTFESKYGTVMIETPGSDLTVEDVVEKLVKPAMLAMGYHSSNIDGIVVEQPGEDTDENTQ